MQETTTYPYAPITVRGFGKTYSSLEKIGPILNQKGLGAANLKCWPNVAWGNLVFQDRVLSIKEENFKLERSLDSYRILPEKIKI